MTESVSGGFEFKAIPAFRIFDYRTAVDFYIGFLGFKIDWEHRFGEAEPIYMQISKNGLVLHLSENKRFEPGAVVFVATTHIKEFHKDVQGRNPAKQLPDILSTGWQTLQMEIADPFGNVLRFNENVSVGKY